MHQQWRAVFCGHLSARRAVCGFSSFGNIVLDLCGTSAIWVLSVGDDNDHDDDTVSRAIVTIHIYCDIRAERQRSRWRAAAEYYTRKYTIYI